MRTALLAATAAVSMLSACMANAQAAGWSTIGSNGNPFGLPSSVCCSYGVRPGGTVAPAGWLWATRLGNNITAQMTARRAWNSAGGSGGVVTTSDGWNYETGYDYNYQ